MEQGTNTQLKLKSAYDSGLSYLKSKQNDDGFWPYLPDRQGALEASCWAAVACRQDNSASKKYIERLLSVQNEDGGWSNESARLESDWSTAAGLLSLRLLQTVNGPPAAAKDKRLDTACRKAEAWLLDNRAESYSGPAKFALLIWKGPEYHYEKGWPWTKDTYGWVEPTAYVLIALKLSDISRQEKIAQIIVLAENFLLQLCLKNGGWNFGDRTPFGTLNPPEPQSTALALLALKNRGQEEKIVQTLKWLSETKSTLAGANEIAWAALALSSYGKECNGLLEKLAHKQANDGSFSGNVLTQAIACLAFDSARSQRPIF